jgi:hypothetical protein
VPVRAIPLSILFIKRHNKVYSKKFLNPSKPQRARKSNGKKNLIDVNTKILILNEVLPPTMRYL